ncbi:MAG: carbamoyltransferase HypF [Chloroflexi bacterium]|nr:carbamoyltransferase HypF [Chloroflexota bacterium]
MNDLRVGQKIWVRGIVQGVGFRPFVYTQALQHHLSGWVRNTSSGVEIQVDGTRQNIQAFLEALHNNPPPLARIDQITAEECPPNGGSSFEIITSQSEAGQFIPISPDVSICEDCQRELFDPNDRRYRYPFINCTNCGPRFTIIKDIPYDRPNTTMASFAMCPECQAEYDDPLDRRFHAQPTACPVCGPHIWLESDGATLGAGEDALQTARRWLRQGKILAVKGLGGYHLACDATNPAAVAELRQRKRRTDKPFALMAFSMEQVERHCCVSAAEKELLLARQRPIVLLDRRPESSVAPETAPQQKTLGVMLPYTPLHLLLLEPEPGYPEVLVMTSGNLSEEPIAYQDPDAHARLHSLADGFLLHDRPIHMRVDDSVSRVIAGQPYSLRRARGYAPDPIRLPEEVPAILATGAELKNTFCLTRQSYAFLSQHIGDLENLETLRSFEEGVQHFEKLFHVQPELLACDLHPDYLSSRYAAQRSQQENLPLIQIQHHHAHLAACLADNGWASDDYAIGLSYDGTGLGTDGAIWGGEVLVGNYRQYQRLYHLQYTPLPGGEAAIHRPARMALAHLWQAGLDWEPDLPPANALCVEERTVLRSQLQYGINTPLTSSMGRLFDAASALLGVRAQANYEAQAAIELENLAAEDESGSYDFRIEGDVFDPAPLWSSLVADWRAGTPLPVLSARFHNSVVQLSLELCQRIRHQTGLATVALSGGVWQNRFLLEKSVKQLQSAGFDVLLHRHVPANDGGLALGQAMIAARVYRSSQWTMGTNSVSQPV